MMMDEEDIFNVLKFNNLAALSWLGAKAYLGPRGFNDYRRSASSYLTVHSARYSLPTHLLAELSVRLKKRDNSRSMRSQH